MWRDVTLLPIEDLDLLQEAGLLWYRVERPSDPNFYTEDETPSGVLTFGWGRRDGNIEWADNQADSFRWYIKEEGG